MAKDDEIKNLIVSAKSNDKKAIEDLVVPFLEKRIDKKHLDKEITEIMEKRTKGSVEMILPPNA